MRIARLATDQGPQYVVDDGARWRFVRDPFEAVPDYIDGAVDYADATFLSPVEPRVVVGMAHNGTDSDRLTAPQAFQKSARTVTGNGTSFSLPDHLGGIIAEAELAIVIRTDARDLRPDNAMDAVLGFTAANDVTAVDQIPLDSFWTQAKNGRNFTPIGPWVETEFDASDAALRLRVNGAIVAESSTARLARGVVDLLVYVTRHVALGPGDVILTGCPGSFSPVMPGDEVTVEIPGLGSLTNLAA